MDLSQYSDEELTQMAGVSPISTGSDSTLSVKNNNPGNMKGPDGGFVSYDSPKAGLAAMQHDLTQKVSGESPIMKAHYGDNYQPTLRNVINTWAPPSENDTDNYVNFVSKHSGLDPDKPLSVDDVPKIMQPMVHMEGGQKASQYFGKLMDSLPPQAVQTAAKSDSPDLSQYSDEELTKMINYNGQSSHEAVKSDSGSFLGDMESNVQSAIRSAQDLFSGNFEDIGAGRLTPKTEALGDKLLQGNTDTSPSGVALSALGNIGNTTPSDFAGALLEKFNATPEGKLLSVINGINPVYNAIGTAVNRYVNPAIAETTGASPDTIQALEMSLGALGGAKAIRGGAEIADPTIPAIKGVAKGADAITRYIVPGEAPLPKQLFKTGDSVDAKPLLVTPKAAIQAQVDIKPFLENDGINLHKVADDLEAAQKVNPNVSALDVMAKDEGGIPGGSNMIGLAKSIAQSPGQGRTMAAEMTGRGYTASKRVSDTFNQGIAKSPYYDLQKDAIQTQEGAGPLYNEAFKANQTIASPAIDKILRTPAGQSALKMASIKMQNDMSLMGKSDPELVEQAKLTGQYIPGDRGLAAGLNLRSLDYVKRAMDDQIGMAQRAGENDNVRVLSGLKNSLVKELDNADVTGRAGPNSTLPEGGAYARARATYATGARVKDALEQGRSFLNMDPEEIQGFINDKGRSNPEKLAFATGARRALQDKIDNQSETTNPINALWKPSLQKRLEPFFSDKQSFDNFSANMEHEKTMARVNQIVQGSPTFQNQAFSKSPAKTALGNGIRAASDPFMFVGGHVADFVDKALTKRAKNMSQDSKTVIMRYLTTKDPQLLRDLAKRIDQKPVKQP